MRLVCLLLCAFAACAAPIPIKVVVVTMFERGADTGDAPGEFQLWVEREKLDQVLPFPQGFHDLRMNRDGVLGTLTGAGTARAAASIMALGLDPRFDLRKAYWIVAGIAGVDPSDASLASAAWAEWVVDGDFGYEIDAREIPANWKTGYIPMGKAMPFQQPREDHGEAFHLNRELVEWAFQLTKDIRLADSAGLRKMRDSFSQENARRSPFVLKGDVVSASTFWYGKLMDRWANEWVKYHTGGKGEFVMTAMEDSGTLQSLSFLAKAGHVDLGRVLVLRTASNFDQPAKGGSADEFSSIRSGASLPALLPAIESAWQVGHVVVRDLVDQWGVYSDRTPSRKLP